MNLGTQLFYNDSVAVASNPTCTSRFLTLFTFYFFFSSLFNFCINFIFFSSLYYEQKM